MGVQNAARQSDRQHLVQKLRNALVAEGLISGASTEENIVVSTIRHNYLRERLHILFSVNNRITRESAQRVLYY